MVSRSLIENFLPWPSFSLNGYFFVIELYFELLICVGLRFFSGPMLSFILFPCAFLYFSSLVDKSAFAFSLAIDPLSFEHSSIRPAILAMSMFFIIFVLSFIGSTILPGMYAMSMHFIYSPFSFILSAATPNVLSVPLDHVIHPSAWVVAAVRP